MPDVISEHFLLLETNHDAACLETKVTSEGGGHERIVQSLYFSSMLLFDSVRFSLLAT